VRDHDSAAAPADGLELQNAAGNHTDALYQQEYHSHTKALMHREEACRRGRGSCKLLPLVACTKLRDQDHAGRELVLS